MNNRAPEMRLLKCEHIAPKNSRIKSARRDECIDIAPRIALQFGSDCAVLKRVYSIYSIYDCAARKRDVINPMAFILLTRQRHNPKTYERVDEVCGQCDADNEHIYCLHKVASRHCAYHLTFAGYFIA